LKYISKSIKNSIIPIQTFRIFKILKIKIYFLNFRQKTLRRKV